MILSIAETISLALRTGFPDHAVPTAVAVAICESELHTDNHCRNCVPGHIEDSRGLWQINVLAHPEYLKVNLFDADVNAKAAFTLSEGGRTWLPWSTYKNGCYQKHLGDVLREMRKPVVVMVNNRDVESAQAYFLADATYGWVRPLCAAVTALIVDYTPQSVTLVRSGREIRIRSLLEGGKSFIHLADLARLPGVTVRWDGERSRVEINTK